MKSKFKKILIGIFICCSVYGIFNLTTNYFNVKADSGWDTDYDSAWDSDSSWGGNSSWDSSSNWDSNSSGSSSISIVVIAVLVIVTVFIILISKNTTSRKEYKKVQTRLNYYEEMEHSKILEIDPNINIADFKLNAFYIYNGIQTAWMNFDTDSIRNLTTDEIYNMYSSQLEALKLKNQKNIMKNITLESIKIINVKKENEIITVDVYLKVKCFDYVINELTNEIVRGNHRQKLNIEYVLSFVKTSHSDSEVKCPGCGAEIEMNSSAICPYCRSTLVKTSDKYVMSKKTCIGQSFDN